MKLNLDGLEPFLFIWVTNPDGGSSMTPLHVSDLKQKEKNNENKD